MSQSVTSADPSTRQDGGLQNKGPERSKVHAVKLNHMPQEKRPGKDSSSCCQPTKQVVHETVNPWLSSTTKVTCLEWIKLVIMFPIALVRLLLIVFLVVPRMDVLQTRYLLPPDGVERSKRSRTNGQLSTRDALAFPLSGACLALPVRLHVYTRERML